MFNIEKSKGKKKRKKVAYWCTFSTIKEVLNLVCGLIKYGSNTFRSIIINSIGEFANCGYEIFNLNKTNFSKANRQRKKLKI